MVIDVDNLITLMRNFTFSSVDFDKSESGEIDEDETTSTGPGPGYPQVTKWETGLVRGSSNQTGNTKWKDSYTIKRGKSNTLL